MARSKAASLIYNLDLETTIDNVPLVNNTLHMQEGPIRELNPRDGFVDGKYLFIPMSHFCNQRTSNNQTYPQRMVVCFPLEEQKGNWSLRQDYLTCLAWPIGWFSRTLNAIKYEEDYPEGIKTGINKEGRIRILANQLKFYGGVLDKIPYSITKNGFFKIDLPFILNFKIIQGYAPYYQAIGKGIWDVVLKENGDARFIPTRAINGDVNLNVPDSLVLAAMDYVYNGGPHIREVLDEKLAKIIKEKRDKEAAERQIREQADRERRTREEQAREEAKRIAEEQERLRLIKAREQESQRMLGYMTEYIKEQEDRIQERQQVIRLESYEEVSPKPYYLFFDTETTGTPRNYKAPVTDSCNWPRLVQLAWIIADKNGNVVKKKSVIIKPNGFNIPLDASAIHGITTERAIREGKPLKEVLDEFITDLSFASQVVGHNIEFDQHVVGAELYRLNMDYSALMYKKSTCTMKSSVNFCAIPNPYSYYGGYKWPSLSELYRKLFGRSFDNAHDALADITATKDCYYELKRKGII